MRPRSAGGLFALLAAVLWLLDAVLATIAAVVGAWSYRALELGATGEAAIALVRAVLTIVFVLLARPASRSDARVSGVLLVVLALAEWLIVHATDHVVGLLATLLTLLGGVLYLVDPD